MFKDVSLPATLLEIVLKEKGRHFCAACPSPAPSDSTGHDLAQNLWIWKYNILLSGTQIDVATTRLSPLLHLSLDLLILRFEFAICRRNYLFIFRGECEELVEILLCVSLSAWSQLTLGATSSCLTSAMLHQGFNLTFYTFHGMILVVCMRQCASEKTNKAIRWWYSVGFYPWLCKMKQDLWRQAARLMKSSKVILRIWTAFLW